MITATAAKTSGCVAVSNSPLMYVSTGTSLI